MIKQVTATIALTTMLGSPMVASADWTDDWMMDVRFNYALTSDVGGTDQDIGDNQHAVTFNGDGIEGESGFGIAFGKRFDNVGISLAYEPASYDYDAAGTVQADGSVFTQFSAPIDMDTWMLELDYSIDMSDSVAFNLLAGIGSTEFDTGTVSPVSVDNSAPGSQATDAVTNSDTSIRFGAGVTYSFSETVALITLLQYTDYGTANMQITDGQTTVTNFDVEATQLSMRLRFMF
jgi:opacity protein-like surface antigen